MTHSERLDFVKSALIPAPVKAWGSKALKRFLPTTDQIADRGGKALTGTVRFLGRHPRIEKMVRDFGQYNLLDPKNRLRNVSVGAGLGTGLGAGVQGLTGLPELLRSHDTESYRALRTPVLDFLPEWINPTRTREVYRPWGGRLQDYAQHLVPGAGIGAAAGGLAGRYGPRAAQLGIGRVLTNVMDPFIYDGKVHGDAIRKIGPREALRAIWRNTPVDVPGSVEGGKAVGAARGRHALFRDFFGMKRLPETEGFWTDVGTVNGQRVVRHNVRDPHAWQEVRDVANARREGFRSNKLIGTKHWNPARTGQLGKDHLVSNGAMGNFWVKPDGAWEDTWDFVLDKNDRINTTEKLLRALVSPFGTPTKTVGRTLNESAALRTSRAQNLSNIHPSFVEPVLNRAARGSGISRKELDNYLTGVTGDQLYPVLNQLSQRVKGRPYNLLETLARRESVTPQEMRVLLGAQPGTKLTNLERLQASRARNPFNLDNVSQLLASRVPGVDQQQAREFLSGLTRSQQADVFKRLHRWSRRGQPQGGELQALATSLGVEPHELAVLLSSI